MNRARFVVVAALAGVVGAAIAGLGYAASGPAASAQQYEYGKKVTICHHTGSRKNPHRTITVSRNAVPAHLRHGDTVGPCPNTNNVRAHSSAAHVRKFHKQATLRAEIARETKAAKSKAKANKAKPSKAKPSKGKPAESAKGKGKGKGKGK